MAELDPGLIAVFAVAAFFLIWYYAAFAYSRRLARRVGTELKGALVSLGGTASIQWFGTTAFRMTAEGTNPPFREVSVTVTLRPREMPINWALGTARGRKDVALVEASLRKDPEISFELVDPLSRVGRRRSQAKSSWTQISLVEREFLLSAKDERKVRRLLEDLGSETMDPVSALHLTAGNQPGIAASLSVEPGHAAMGIATVRMLAERLAA